MQARFLIRHASPPDDALLPPHVKCHQANLEFLPLSDRSELRCRKAGKIFALSGCAEYQPALPLTFDPKVSSKNVVDQHY